jgi:hypothetical protein
MAQQKIRLAYVQTNFSYSLCDEKTYIANVKKTNEDAEKKKFHYVARLVTDDEAEKHVLLGSLHSDDHKKYTFIIPLPDSTISQLVSHKAYLHAVFELTGEMKPDMVNPRNQITIANEQFRPLLTQVAKAMLIDFIDAFESNLPNRNNSGLSFDLCYSELYKILLIGIKVHHFTTRKLNAGETIYKCSIECIYKDGRPTNYYNGCFSGKFQKDGNKPTKLIGECAYMVTKNNPTPEAMYNDYVLFPMEWTWGRDNFAEGIQKLMQDNVCFPKNVTVNVYNRRYGKTVL